MIEPILDTLTQRLDRLEREVRWWRFGTLGVLLLLAGVGAAPRGTTLEAERLILRDASGKPRLVLGVETPQRGWPQPPASPEKKAPSPQQELGLFLYGQNGVEVARLTDWHGAGALLAMADPHQQAQASLSVQKGLGAFGISTSDKALAQQLREAETLAKQAEREKWDEKRSQEASRNLFRSASVKLAAGQLGPYLSYHLAGETERGRTLLGDFGGPSLQLMNPRLVDGVDLSARELRFRDERGKKRVTLRLDDDGVPSLDLFDRDGRSRAVLGQAAVETIRTGEVQQRTESSLVLFDKDGKVIWKVP